MTTPRGWSGGAGSPTTLVLVRHGSTAHTAEKRFSGGVGSGDPSLSEEGIAQVRATAGLVETLAPDATRLLASPVRRAVESASLVAERLALPVDTEPGVAEMEFGAWDGLTFAEVGERDPEGLRAWLGSLSVPPGGAGESILDVASRVRSTASRLVSDNPGQTLVLVSHVTPIKVLVAEALGAPLEAVYRMELSPASVSVISWWPGDSAPAPSLRGFNLTPR